MASRGIDFLITYRVTKLLVTPFEKQEAYKFGIIDDKGKVLAANVTGIKQGPLLCERPKRSKRSSQESTAEVSES